MSYSLSIERGGATADSYKKSGYLQVRLHPIVIMITLIIASDIAGLWGVPVGVPLVAAARDVFAYFYSEWSDRGGSEDIPEDTADEPIQVILEDN